jgi:hypothetical protein
MYRWKKQYPERTTDHGQATGKLYHLQLRVGCTLFCNLQSRARTHTILVIGIYIILYYSSFYLISVHFSQHFAGPGWLNELGRWIT